MLQYTVKRLLLMIPTFFAISLVIFLVLNIAPGRPGEIGQQMGESKDSQAGNESFRFFKEQFALDRPILFNTRFLVDTGDVRDWLVTAHALSGKTSSKHRIRAKEKLEDYGNRLVQHLIPILRDDDDPELRRLAAYHLTVAAQRRYLREGRGTLVFARMYDFVLRKDGRESARDEEIRAYNERTRKQNEEIRDLSWTAEEPERAAEVTAAWLAWWDENRSDFTWGFGENASAFLFDTRFANYWGNLFRLDFGVSTVDFRPVLPTILSKLKYSLSLTLVSVLLAYLIAVPLGIFSAVRQGTLGDTVATVILFVMYSLPTFFTGTVLLKLFSEGDPWAWFPTGGFETVDSGPQTTIEHVKDVAWHLVLPIATYTSVALAALSRYARAGVIDVIRADYIRTARAKGLSEPVVILKHAARNGMIPILTLLGSLLPILVSGSVVIEVVFGIPGMGMYLYDSINLRDYNAVMGVLLIASILTLFGILLSDISYALADPRISLD